MSKLNGQAERDAEQRAHEWLVYLDSSEATAADRERFEQWLALDERHRMAWREAAAIWHAAATLQTLRRLEPAPGARPRRTGWLQRVRGLLSLPAVPGRYAFAAAATLAAVAIGVLLTRQGNAPQIWSLQTAVAEQRTLALPDGSEIALSPKSRIEVRYDDGERRVELRAGEAFFSVVKDAARPFVVASGHTEVTVLGTRFNVNANAVAVTVAVEQGHVRVAGPALASAEPARAELRAGQQLSVTEGRGLGRIESIDAASAGAWREGVRSYQGEPLAQVLQDLARYQHAKLVIVDPAIGELPVNAVFPTAHAAQMLAALETVLPVSVVEASPGRIEIRARSEHRH